MQHFQKETEKTAPDEDLAIAILVWLSNEPDMLNRFCALSGVEAGQLRALTEDPGFERAMIGFIAGHEPTLMAFCNDNGIAPETISRAWQKLEYGEGSGR
ncbi:DUF3572 domain-containing protein [Martelella radicis]|uniref:DUF3572 family protein n=1 Tax=Martelella radicis TaxID=1397476 RepID=A0A7W6PAL8_9HYPH|nr:DUF3572 domain-containing protein [Martelella radicis]MBB4121557.1 hypothetical protein [Martelella radicis]